MSDYFTKPLFLLFKSKIGEKDLLCTILFALIPLKSHFITIHGDIWGQLITQTLPILIFMVLVGYCLEKTPIRTVIKSFTYESYSHYSSSSWFY